ncbi:hypothetical protein [Stutzerimonas stutzeri]|uniref:hypothetical protein n=1 Tax=Stutzerimonas stutzeri TaxID=316 RepID=UPI001C2EA198|nr:hypothetical protein [Stutzerimonas stutzeri]
MTIRNVINIRIRFASAAVYGGLLLTGGSIQYFLNQNKEPPFLSFSIFFLGFALMLAIKFTTKCPACKGNIGSTLMNSGSPVALSKKVKHCPLCGINIDQAV